MELPELELFHYDIEPPTLKDIVFEYKPFEVELPDIDVELLAFDFELPTFEPSAVYQF